MHELIENLQEYHRQKARHLFELESCVNDLIEFGPSEGYAQTLRTLFEPFQNTTEVAHHHNEELILGELRNTSAPIHRRVDEIPTDHEAFNKIVVEIATQIRDPEVGCAELCAIIKNFVLNYSDHADGEESIFFPIADKYLQSDHWSRIQQAWK